jgi:hypothetical protein
MIIEEPRRRLVVHDLTLDSFLPLPASNHYRFLGPGERGSEREFKPLFAALESLYGNGSRSPLMLPGAVGRLFSREWRSFPLLKRWPWPFEGFGFRHVHAWYDVHQGMDGMPSQLDLTDASTPQLRRRTYQALEEIPRLIVSSKARKEMEEYSHAPKALYG